MKLCSLIAAVAVVVPAAAAPGAPPAPTTAGAQSVTSTSAVLTGSVNPDNQATTYHFEYGPTITYGASTPDQGPTPASKGKIAVSAAISGLTPGATYHYRLVATNASGTRAAGDKNFTTAAGLSLTRSPGAITLGRQATLSGQLSAASPAGVKVTLEADPAPYNASEFTPITTATTDATGKFTFAQAPAANTEYRVTATKPSATSNVVTVGVRLRVTMTLSTTRPKRGHSVTFGGSVTPPRNGQLVRIQKRVGSRWRTVTTTLLSATSDPGVSTYKKRVRIRKRGVYRAYVSGDVANLAGASGRRTVRVR
jgi:hypothetical protein